MWDDYVDDESDDESDTDEHAIEMNDLIKN
jgi:hypothetical protein